MPVKLRNLHDTGTPLFCFLLVSSPTINNKTKLKNYLTLPQNKQQNKTTPPPPPNNQKQQQKQRERERERQTETETERETERERQRERQRETERETERQRQKNKETERATERKNARTQTHVTPNTSCIGAQRHAHVHDVNIYTPTLKKKKKEDISAS